MQRLIDIGFVRAGSFVVDGDNLSAKLHNHGETRNVLYAFAVDDRVAYIGQTIQALRQRMRGYERPAEKQSTNYGNHHRIRLALAEGSTVLILAMADHGQYRVGDFHLNLAAGLEADLIRQLGPAWNGGTRKTSLRVVTDCTPTSSTTIVRATTSFSVPLSPTYVAQGFFNVPAQHSPSIGRAGEPIELFLGDATVPLIGMIDRSTNRNGSPRIRRCAALRHWLAARVSNGDDAVAVEVMSSNALRLMATPHSAAA